jgi:DHA3 family macrolide efflux protein-like MFS transporter
MECEVQQLRKLTERSRGTGVVTAEHTFAEECIPEVHGGTRIFFLIWFGQLISLLGSGLTSFSLSLWAYQRSGSMLHLAMIIGSFAIPGIVVAPIAGAVIDRWDHRWAMACGAAGAGLCTVGLAVLFLTGRLELWHICLGVCGISISGAFQWPAYTAATTLLLSKEQFARATGLMQIALALTMIVCPPLAVTLLPRIHVQGILFVDLSTYCFVIAVLFGVRIPKPTSTAAGREWKGSFLFEVTSGWAYVNSRRGLLWLLALGASILFASSMTQILIIPLVLGLGSAKVLATLISVCSAGMLVGGVLMATWGGPRHRVRGVAGAGMLVGLALILSGLSTWPLLVAVGLFALACATPISLGCSQVVWQIQVPPDLQGRVFAVRKMFSDACLPVAAALSVPLVDKIFGPLLLPGGGLAQTVGRFTGVGSGRGTGLLLAILGLLTVLVSACALLVRSLRTLETESPVPSPKGTADLVLNGATRNSDQLSECKSDSMIQITGGFQ